MARRIAVVPSDVALAYAPGLGWHLVDGPPGWLEDAVRRSDELDAAPRLRLVPAASSGAPASPVTPCRPGRGPCRRRHVHGSPRRAEAA